MTPEAPITKEPTIAPEVLRRIGAGVELAKSKLMTTAPIELEEISRLKGEIGRELSNAIGDLFRQAVGLYSTNRAGDYSCDLGQITLWDLQYNTEMEDYGAKLGIRGKTAQHPDKSGRLVVSIFEIGAYKGGYAPDNICMRVRTQGEEKNREISYLNIVFTKLGEIVSIHFNEVMGISDDGKMQRRSFDLETVKSDE